MKSRTLVLSALFLAAAGVAWALVATSTGAAIPGTGSPSRPTHAAAPKDDLAAAPKKLEDAPIAAWRIELLDLAFQTASKIPVAPHVKSRSRAQADVVEMCLKLDQPVRALAYVDQIANWERGAGYAALACWCAQNGRAADARTYAEKAALIAENLSKWTSRYETEQSWRRDRIRAGIARTHLLLGDMNEAEKLAADLDNSEVGPVTAAKYARIDASELDAHLRAIDDIVQKGDFDLVKSALEGCVSLVDRFYADESRRSAAEQKVEASWTKMPPQVRFGLAMDIARIALDHQDRSHALELLSDARGILDSATWQPEQQVALTARLAASRARAGDEAGARKEAEAALALFDAQRAKIVDIYRAGALRPVAQAYAAMGDRSAALATYRRAVDEGAVNQNSKPRAEDLAHTCVSIVESAVEPDESLKKRMRELHDGLREPW